MISVLTLGLFIVTTAAAATFASAAAGSSDSRPVTTCEVASDNWDRLVIAGDFGITNGTDAESYIQMIAVFDRAAGVWSGVPGPRFVDSTGQRTHQLLRNVVPSHDGTGMMVSGNMGFSWPVHDGRPDLNVSVIGYYDFTTGQWDDMDGGLPGVPEAMVPIKEADGSETWYIGGDFAYVGARHPVNASGIGKWRRDTGWSVLGASGEMNTLFVNLYPICFGFPLPPDPLKSVKTIVHHNGKLYVGGVFDGIGGVAANYSAIFDLASQTWAPAGHGVSVGTNSVCIMNRRPPVMPPLAGNCSFSWDQPTAAALWYCCADTDIHMPACVQPGGSLSVDTSVLAGSAWLIVGGFKACGAVNLTDRASFVQYDTTTNQWSAVEGLIPSGLSVPIIYGVTSDRSDSRYHSGSSDAASHVYAVTSFGSDNSPTVMATTVPAGDTKVSGQWVSHSDVWNGTHVEPKGFTFFQSGWGPDGLLYGSYASWDNDLIVKRWDPSVNHGNGGWATPQCFTTLKAMGYVSNGHGLAIAFMTRPQAGSDSEDRIRLIVGVSVAVGVVVVIGGLWWSWRGRSPLTARDAEAMSGGGVHNPEAVKLGESDPLASSNTGYSALGNSSGRPAAVATA